MGEPYFTHLGITPQKVHPFAVIVPPSAMKAPDTHFVPLHQLIASRLSHGLSQDKSFHLMAIVARSYRAFSDHLKTEAKLEAAIITQKQEKQYQHDFPIPLSYNRAPGLPDYHEPVDIDLITDTHYNAKTPLLKREGYVPRKSVILKEQTPPEFANTLSIRDKAVQAVGKVTGLIKPLLKRPDPAKTPNLSQDFDQNLKDFTKTVDGLSHEPRPEKW